MKKITVSAPGKLVLLGDHAVVYQRPCLVTAVDQRIFVSIEKNNIKEFILNAPDVEIKNYKKFIKDLGKREIPKGAKFIEFALLNTLKKTSLQSGLTITTKSEFSSKFGFGSSSAVTVCVVKALSEMFGLNLTNKEIFDLSYKTVLDIQKKGSGVDVAAAVYGGTLYFLTAGKIIEQLSIKDFPLVVGYSGIKADTVTLVNQVKDKFKNKQKQLDQIYDEIAKIVNEARQALLEKNFDLFGQLMNVNQDFLNQLGVSIQKLDIMINSAKDAGAYGAKLSGAGGGDCMIAMSPEKTKAKIQKAIEKVGGEIIKVKVNAKGVRIES